MLLDGFKPSAGLEDEIPSLGLEPNKGLLIRAEPPVTWLTWDVLTAGVSSTLITTGSGITS